MARALSAPSDAAPHLLVVDDDRRIRDLLLRFLLAEGYRVTTAETAAEARAKLGGLSFDLLILDVMMPGETGFDLARAIRVASSVPILMLTARDEAENRIKGLEFGADDYLAKPFEPRELLLRVNSILRRGATTAKPLIEVVRFGPSTLPTANARSCRSSPLPPATRFRAWHSSPATARPASARLTCRSIGCVAR